MIPEIENRESQGLWNKYRPKRRRGHWNPSTKSDSIYEDEDASVQIHAETENDVDARQRHSSKESNRAKDVKQDAVVRKYWDTRREWNHYGNFVKGFDASSRPKKGTAERPKQHIQDQLLTDMMRPRQERMRADLVRGFSCTEKRNTDSNCRRRNENMRNGSSCSTNSVARSLEGSPSSRKVILNETIISRKRVKNSNSENSTCCVKNASKPRRVLQQCLSDRCQLNFDIIYDRPGQKTGKENVPPGTDENCAQKNNRPFVMTKIRPKALSRSTPTQKSIQKQSPAGEEYSSLIKDGARLSRRRPMRAPTASKEQPSREKMVCDTEDDCKSMACMQSKLYNWTTFSVKTSQMASQSLNSVSLPLSCGPESNSCRTPTTRTTISCTRPNFQQRQHRTSRSVLPRFTDKAILSPDNKCLQYDLLVNETANNDYLSKLSQYSIFVHIHQEPVQYRDRQPESQDHAQVQQVLLTRSNSDQSQYLLYQAMNPQIHTDSIKYLDHPSKIHVYEAMLRDISPLGLEWLLRTLYFSMQTHFLSLNIRNSQFNDRRMTINGNITSLSINHYAKYAEPPTAAQLTRISSEHSHLRDPDHAVFPMLLKKEQDITSCLLVSIHDHHTRLLLCYATFVYIYALYEHILQAVFRLISLALRVDLDIFIRYWSWSIKF